MPVDPTYAVEQELFAGGAPLIIGLDEVGRGALAGPVMVGACVLLPAHSESGIFPEHLRDSKLVTEKRRPNLAVRVQEWAQVRVGEASAIEIEAFGIVPSLGLAAKRALTALYEIGVDISSATILLDGSHDYLTPVLANPLTVVVRPKADQDCVSVAAASVVAKVTRDELMRSLHEEHPAYHWESNKGYGSASHLTAAADSGLTVYHRTSWVKVTGSAS